MFKKKKDLKSDMFLLVFSLIFMVFMTGILAIIHINRVEAYNRVTGNNISAWDAWLLDLRVVGEAKPSEQ